MTERATRSRTPSVVLALAPEPAVAVIVVVPALRPVASPVASIVATVVLLLAHVTPVPPIPLMVTGVAEPVVLPFPNWPTPLPGPSAPQHFTEPSDRSAQVCKPPWPAAMEMALVGGEPLPITLTVSGYLDDNTAHEYYLYYGILTHMRSV